MDAAQALADLAQVSSQIESAILVGADGTVLASTLPDDATTADLARAVAAFVRAADESAARGGRASLTQVLAETPSGAVLAARDGSRTVAAVTGPEPTAGLVFYDLKTCLRLAGEEERTDERA